MKSAMLCTIFIVFIPTAILAQNEAVVSETDTLDFQYAKQDIELDFVDFNYYNLNGFHNYRPIGRRHLPWARSSNFGLPFHSYELRGQDWSISHHLGAYHPYLITGDSIRYYRMSRPFTQLDYTNGAEAEQFFKAFHSQNLGEGLNISFRFDRMSSEGFFLRQLTNHTRFHTSYNLKNRDGRFRSRGYFLINNLEAQENGGVFISENDDPEDNTALLDINLLDAQNRLRSQELYFHNKVDLIERDSTFTWLSFSHQIKWAKAWRDYSDDLTNNTSNFYDQSLLDDNMTSDSSYVEELTNILGLEFLNHRLFVAWKRSDFLYFQNFLINEEFKSEFIQAGFRDSLLNQWVEINFEKGLSGYHRDEIDLEARVGLQKFGNVKSEVFFLLKQKQPDFFLERQRANHRFYNQTLSTAQFQSIGGQLKEEWSGVKLQVQYLQMNNYAYFDSSRNVRQNSSQLEGIKAELSKQFTFFKHWNLFNRIAYQEISDENILPLPNLYSYHSFYYENRFFKQSLQLQAGVDFYYIGEYRGYGYDPSLAQMHLKKNDNELGNINQLDLFLNLGINKSARIFVKYENILNPNFDESTYRIQDYPIPGRALKFGLSWRMIN